MRILSQVLRVPLVDFDCSFMHCTYVATSSYLNYSLLVSLVWSLFFLHSYCGLSRWMGGHICYEWLFVQCLCLITQSFPLWWLASNETWGDDLNTSFDGQVNNFFSWYPLKFFKDNIYTYLVFSHGESVACLLHQNHYSNNCSNIHMFILDRIRVSGRGSTWQPLAT